MAPLRLHVRKRNRLGEDVHRRRQGHRVHEGIQLCHHVGRSQPVDHARHDVLPRARRRPALLLPPEPHVQWPDGRLFLLCRRSVRGRDRAEVERVDGRAHRRRARAQVRARARRLAPCPPPSCALPAPASRPPRSGARRRRVCSRGAAAGSLSSTTSTTRSPRRGRSPTWARPARATTRWPARPTARWPRPSP